MPGRSKEPSRRKPWVSKDDIETLPLARCQRGVDQRWVLPVDCSGLAVRVGDVLVGIEHLHLVEPHQEDTTITAALTVTLRR